MSWDNKVVWSEGMFLRTQHFQQQDRYFERLVRGRTQSIRPHAWGFSSLTLDRALLSTGRFAVAEAAGVFPDGTPFTIPDDADHPPALELPPDTRNAVVYLTLPVRQPGGREFGNGAATDLITRYEAAEFEANDAVAGAESRALLRVGKLRLRYAVEPDDRAGYLSLGLARVVEVRPDKSAVVDDGFIAPCLNCECQHPLKSFAEELLGLLRARGEALAARLAQPGNKGASEIADFMLLQLVNRYEPLVAHFATDCGQLHPEAFFARLIEMAGELATFGNVRTRRAAQFPAYRHDDLQRAFGPVIIELRQLLSAIIESTAVLIPFQQHAHGVRIAVVSDRNLLAFAAFVLAARARLPADRIQATFPRHVKIGPVEQIVHLVNSALPGVGVRGLAVAPRQLPFKANTCYFELDRSSPFWQQLQRAGSLALHVPEAEFPELELELWAIKS